MVVLTNFPPPEDGIKHQQPNTRAIFNNADLGSGTLYIAESRISWIESSTGRGYSLEYPNVSLHAVCRDLSSFPEECLYLMLDKYVNIDNETSEQNGGHDNDDGDEDDEESSSEVRFVPQDKTSLNNMYNAMSECQALHPDPNDSLSEDSSATGEEYDDAEEEEEGVINGHKDFHGNGDMDMDVEGQFDDAEP